ncbi:MAG: uroporphyrinogen-III C-methyltransferase [Actinobacteria bacterium]|nr:uroporphyrinogen-III C-methyltransferase [Actinomycetota bacterium]
MTGRVVVIGGGPGAPDLITVRGLDRLLAADVVVVDRLAPRELLKRLRPGVEVIDCSRTPDRRELDHEQIVALLIARARAGHTVARLKGGDPFVFAHGGQEVAACTAAGITVEVVPGLSSATAAPALAGLSLTAVDGAAGFTVVSGHLDPNDPANRVDWRALARAGTTIVVLMGMRRLAAIVGRLQQDGLAPQTPTSVIAEASGPGQRVIDSTLGAVVADVASAGLRNPAVVVVEAGGRPATARRTLVLGGSRSGKSDFAQSLVGDRSDVRYIATAERRADDAEWLARIARHEGRRPASWTTVETTDLVATLRAEDGPVIIDSVTTWLGRVMDECGFWSADGAAGAALTGRLDAFVGQWADTAATVVAVSDEVGSGVVPATASGRAFRDALGELNQRLAAGADEVWLVTAGIPRRLR